MSSLESKVRALGATDQQINSKTFQLAERAVAEGHVDGMHEVNKALASLKYEIAHMHSSISSAETRALRNYNDASRLTDKASKTVEDAKDLIETAGNLVEQYQISDEVIRNAVNAYTLILQRTKDVLGEDKLTDAVIVQLLETASYGLWRSIMGPKSVNDSRYKN